LGRGAGRKSFAIFVLVNVCSHVLGRMGNLSKE
jgi:hypothetical protein